MFFIKMISRIKAYINKNIINIQKRKKYILIFMIIAVIISIIASIVIYYRNPRPFSTG